jgi:hypothetical protein
MSEEGKRIKKLIREGDGLREASIKKYVEAGRKLIAKKESLNHGEWLPWLEAEGIKHQRANECVRLASALDGKSPEGPAISEDMSQVQALAVIVKPRPKTRAEHRDDAAEAVAKYQAQLKPKKAKRRKKPPKPLLTPEQIEAFTPTDAELEADAPRIARIDKEHEVNRDQWLEKTGWQQSHISKLIEKLPGFDYRNHEAVNELFAALDMPDIHLSPGQIQECLGLIGAMKATIIDIENELLKLVPLDWDAELKNITEDES